VPLGEEDDIFVVEGNVDDFESEEDMDDSDDDSIRSYQSIEEAGQHILYPFFDLRCYGFLIVTHC
jgi:hypothetical protein